MNACEFRVFSAAEEPKGQATLVGKWRWLKIIANQVKLLEECPKGKHSFFARDLSVMCEILLGDRVVELSPKWGIRSSHFCYV